ncbi:hypothetical protein ACFY36_20335 [Actinoplanes sp. NPDC000266]
MTRSRVLWGILVGVGCVYAMALLTMSYLFDATPSHLYFAGLPLYGVALGLLRGRLRDRADSGNIRSSH